MGRRGSLGFRLVGGQPLVGLMAVGPTSRELEFSGRKSSKLLGLFGRVWRRAGCSVGSACQCQVPVP